MGGGSFATGGAGAGGGRWDAARDLPALQVRYRVVQQPLSPEDLMDLAAWDGSETGDAPPQPVPLLEEECEAVTAALVGSTGLLPPSARAAHDGMLLGFLPFLEAHE